MTSLLQLVLMVGPLALYFYILAAWQASRHARVVSGLLDLVLLAGAVGGLLCFGPVGQALAEMCSGQWGVVAGFVVLAAAAPAVAYMVRHASRRLVVYHVDPKALNQALSVELGAEPGRFAASVTGFEDAANGRRVTVEINPLLGAAVIETWGGDPETLIDRLRPRLQARLRESDARPSPAAWVLLGLSALTLLAPLTGLFLTQPKARAALRVLLERLQGG
jgi:hypothetical protein